MSQRYNARCYYVKHPKNGWWGYFTVVQELGLLQIHSDFGVYAHRWNAPGPDFGAFLLRVGPDYLAECLESQVPRKAGGRIPSLLTYLWPLFIEQLKAELQEAGVA